jgi:hypothetical protein
MMEGIEFIKKVTKSQAYRMVHTCNSTLGKLRQDGLRPASETVSKTKQKQKKQPSNSPQFFQSNAC